MGNHLNLLRSKHSDENVLKILFVSSLEGILGHHNFYNIGVSLTGSGYDQEQVDHVAICILIFLADIGGHLVCVIFLLFY